VQSRAPGEVTETDGATFAARSSRSFRMLEHASNMLVGILLESGSCETPGPRLRARARYASKEVKVGKRVRRRNRRDQLVVEVRSLQAGRGKFGVSYRVQRCCAQSAFPVKGIYSYWEYCCWCNFACIYQHVAGGRTSAIAKLSVSAAAKLSSHAGSFQRSV